MDKVNNWKKVTVTNIPDGGRFLVYKDVDESEIKTNPDYPTDPNNINVISEGEAFGGIVSHCHYDQDFIIRVRCPMMLPIEFHSRMLKHREEALIEMKEDK